MESIIAIIAAVFALLFGIERIRRKNADRRADNAEAGKHKAEAEKAATEAGLQSERKVAEKIGEIDEKEKSYSEAVEDFNWGRR